MASSSDVHPLYIKNSDSLPTDLSPLDICNAMARVVGVGKVDGAQRVKNLWRLHLKDKKARSDLFVKQQLAVNGRNVQIYDSNPYSTISGRPQPINDKITIRDVPLFVSNDKIRSTLIDAGVRFMSPVKDSFERDADGALTTFRNGDRFAYIEKTATPIQRFQQIDGYMATIIHHGKDNRPCKACNEIGHRIGSEECPAFPKVPIYAFKSYKNPLSNHFPCNLYMFDEETPFKSYEHALFWKMGMDLGLPHQAYLIKESEHAGAAKALS